MGRSQYAEAFYNAFVKAGGAVSVGINPPEGRDCPSNKNVQVMKEAGIDISKAKVKLLHEDMLYDVKKVVSFVEREELPDYVQKFDDLTFWKVDDPHFCVDLDGRRKIRDIIRKKVLELK